MSFTGNHLCTSFRKELFEAKHDWRTHVFKLALYTEDATLNADTTDYTATEEVTGTNYSAGGVTLTNLSPSSDGHIGIAGFEDVTLSNVTLTARGALIYNTTADGGVGTTSAVCVLDFGRNITKTAQDMVITMPTFDQLNALLRI